MPLRAQLSAAASLPSLGVCHACSYRAFASAGVGKGCWIATTHAGTPHDRALIPGARRRLLGSAQVGWRHSPRLAAKGAPGAGKNPTVRVTRPGLCTSLVVGGPQVRTGPPGRHDVSMIAVYGPWEGEGCPSLGWAVFLLRCRRRLSYVALPARSHGVHGRRRRRRRPPRGARGAC